jgi:hypothetical protein
MVEFEFEIWGGQIKKLKTINKFKRPKLEKKKFKGKFFYLFFLGKPHAGGREAPQGQVSAPCIVGSAGLPPAL